MNSFRDNNNAYSESKIAALFQHYKDPLEDAGTHFYISLYYN